MERAERTVLCKGCAVGGSIGRMQEWEQKLVWLQKIGKDHGARSVGRSQANTTCGSHIIRSFVFILKALGS